MAERFASLTEGDLESILDERDAVNTKKVIKASTNILNEYLRAKNSEITDITQLEQAETLQVVTILRKFYCEVRKTDGSFYAKKSMITLRFGLQKHFLKTREEDIVNNEQYKSANEIFKAVLVKLKKEGIGDVKHKDSITQDDLRKLYQSDCFKLDNPQSLQNRVFFEFIYYNCNRGRENVREVKKEDFEINTDSLGRKYIRMKTKRQTKNHRGDDIRDHDDKEGRIYENPGDKDCPVAAFQLYLSKLHPQNPYFWQRPKKVENMSENLWYDNMAVGKNTLGKIMAKVSEEAGLSKRYTNHCIRATCITNLDENGIETRHIMEISGHKSESSVRSYTKRLGEQKQREISNILSSCVKSETEPAPKIPRKSQASSTLQAPNFPDFLDDALNIPDILTDSVLENIENFENNYTATNNVQIPNYMATNNFQLPHGFSIQNISGSNIHFHFDKN